MPFSDEEAAAIRAQAPPYGGPTNEALIREMIARALARGDDIRARALAAQLPPITGDIAITEPADGIAQP